MNSRLTEKLVIIFLTAAVSTGAEQENPGSGSFEEPIRLGSADSKQTASEQGHEFWSFQPLRPALPLVLATRQGNWSHTMMDWFVLEKLEEEELQLSPEANRSTLIRRLYFDVLGLPPSPEQVLRFVQDESPLAYSQLIDRLLGNPHYGERWARHWLDIARFAESNGFERDEDRPSAYRYRDFLIETLNQDLPYHQFVSWQVAGDLLAPGNSLANAATGFLVGGVANITQTEKEFERDRYDELDDMATTVGTAFLGLTIGCARCHDHKYDPISQREYYRFLASFAKTVGRPVPLKKTTAHEGGEMEMVYAAKEIGSRFSNTDMKEFNVFGDKDRFVLNANVHFLDRGDLAGKQEIMSQGFFQVLTANESTDDRWTKQGQGPVPLRIALANWLTDVEFGAGRLLARVIVNRLWQHHMGVGLVSTPSDFGSRSGRPSHPELLDWLALQLIRHDWQLKPIHRLIITSAVYRQSYRQDRVAARIDPQNRLLWRRSLRRLDAEVIRDAMLAVSGVLDMAMFGPGTLDEASRRRSIYFTVKRSELMKSLQRFDAPDALQGMGRRQTTTVAPQALFILNNKQVTSYAESFARRIKSVTTAELTRAVDNAFLVAVSRVPRPDERTQMVGFVKNRMAMLSASQDPEPQHALSDLCHLLLCCNEFIYVE